MLDADTMDGGVVDARPVGPNMEPMPTRSGHVGQIVNWAAWSVAVPVIVIGLVCGLALAYPFNAIAGITALCAILYSAYLYYDAKCRSFTVDEERIITRKGVFNPITNNLQLYRVRDVQVREPFIYRPFSLGNVIIISSDRSTPELVLRAIGNPHEISETIRHNTERDRFLKGVREVDH